MKAIIGSCAAALIFCGAGAARAHETGNERRTEEQCKNFEKGMNKHKLKACLTCVGKGEHHFHPQGKKGKRCSANMEKGEKAEGKEAKEEKKEE